MTQDLNEKIENVLRSADGMGRAMPAPYLLTRVSAVLQNADTDHSVWNRIATMLRNPAMAFAVLASVVIVNIMIITNDTSATNRDNVNSRTLSVKDELAINVSATYDIENQEP